MLSEKLKQSRILAKVTQVEAAECLSISDRTIRQYETGKLLPPLDKIEALSRLYSVPITYLVTDFDTESNSVKQWLNSLSVAELEEIKVYISDLIEQKST